MSLSPTLHQVCSSDFVTDSWISLTSPLGSYFLTTTALKRLWRAFDIRHFRLLSTLCRLANKTVDDAVYRFDMRSLVTLNVLTEPEFYVQLNTTLIQFIQSLTIQFNLLINTTQLLTQVDQPFTNSLNAELIIQTIANAANDPEPPQVHLCSTNKSVLFSVYQLYCDSEPL
jgi:hypothetical protein